MKNGVVKKMIPIFMSSFIAWFYCMIYTPLGYIYNTYVGVDAQVMLIATLPGIVAMIGGFAAAGLMNSIGRKQLVLGSMVIMIIGAFMCRFFGDKGIMYAIVGSGMTGFAAGSIPAANFSALSEIATEKLKDKVFGWSDFCCQAGLIVAPLLGGIFAASGEWVKAFDVYWIAVAVFVLSIFWYPANQKATESEKEHQENTEEVNEKIPGSVIACIVIKLLAGCFYMGLSLFVSDLVINEIQGGTSAIVGTMNSLASLVAALSAAFVFLWMKLFKKTSTMIAMCVMGVFMLVAATSGTVAAVFVCFLLMSLGMNSHHSSFSTVIANATKGKAVGIASGLFVGSTFVGEALCGYVTPWLANLLFGTTVASACIKAAGIGCIVVGVIGFFAFRKAYAIAFPDGKEKEA